MSNFLALTRMRIQLTIRNKMFLFFSVIMPFGFLLSVRRRIRQRRSRGRAVFAGSGYRPHGDGQLLGTERRAGDFREQGILRRFHVTPVTPSDMLASSIVSNYVLTLPTVLIEILFARIFFHVHDFGDVLTVFILVTVGTVSFASLGLVVASVTNTMQETQVINQLLWLPLIFLSGATVPLPSLPAGGAARRVFLPATYLVNSLQRAIFFSVPITRLLVDVVALCFWAADHFFCVFTTVPLGAGIQNPRVRRNLGRGHCHSIFASRRL